LTVSLYEDLRGLPCASGKNLAKCSKEFTFLINVLEEIKYIRAIFPTHLFLSLFFSAVKTEEHFICGNFCTQKSSIRFWTFNKIVEIFYYWW